MLTRKAAVALAAAGAIAVLAVSTQSYAAAVLAAAIVLLFAVNAFYAAAPDLEGELAIGAGEVSEEQRVDVELRLANRSASSVVFERRLATPDVFEAGDAGTRRVAMAPGEDRSWAMGPHPRLFGGYEIGPVELRVRDPSAFRVEEHTIGASRKLLVRPLVEELDTVPLRLGDEVRFFGVHGTNQPGDGFEFYTLRQWQEGDSIRSVNWRATARTGDDELIVNQRARESYVSVAVLLDGSRSAFEGRVIDSPYANCGRAVASLAAFLLDNRDEVQFRLLGDQTQVVHPQAAARQLRRITEAISTTRPSGTFRWDEAVDDLLPTLNPAQPVVLASAFETDPTIVPAVKRLAAREHSVLVVSAPTRWRAGQRPEHAELRRRHRAMVRDEVRRSGGTFVDVGQDRPLTEAFLEAVIA